MQKSTFATKVGLATMLKGGVMMDVVDAEQARITRVGGDVDVLATFRGEPVLVRQGVITGAAFHPELTDDLRVHRLAFGERDGPGARSHGDPC